jgi:hypothetical protein
MLAGYLSGATTSDTTSGKQEMTPGDWMDTPLILIVVNSRIYNELVISFGSVV